MTPKEKAIELSQKFIGCYVHTDGSEYWLDAKRCALIAVDEIIGELDQIRKPEYTMFIIGDEGFFLDGYEKKYYWEAVKKEISSL